MTGVNITDLFTAVNDIHDSELGNAKIMHVGYCNNESLNLIDAFEFVCHKIVARLVVAYNCSIWPWGCWLNFRLKYRFGSFLLFNT